MEQVMNEALCGVKKNLCGKSNVECVYFCSQSTNSEDVTKGRE